MILGGFLADSWRILGGFLADSWRIPRLIGALAVAGDDLDGAKRGEAGGEEGGVGWGGGRDGRKWCRFSRRGKGGRGLGRHLWTATPIIDHNRFIID